MIFNVDAEQYYLGAILLEPDLAKEARCTADMFSPSHKLIMNAIEQCVKKDIIPEVIAVATEMRAGIETIGGLPYLAELAGSVPTTSNIKHYENFIINAYKMRRGYEAANKFLSNAQYGQDPDMLTMLSQEINEINEMHQKVETKTWRDTLMDLLNDSYEDDKGITGIDTGFKDLNRMTDGLQGNNLIIIGARPSMGKTAFALNIGANACMLQDARVEIFSLETPEKRLAKRIISSTGHINAEYMRRMQFPDEATRAKFTATVGMVDKFDLHIHDKSSITVEEIRSIVAAGHRQAVKEGKKHLVIIDYLQLINYIGPLNNPVQQIGHISRALKVMASDYDIPVVALSQLSRKVEERQDKRPMMSDIRESGNIEQDADVIAFLYRDDYYDKESEAKNITEIIIAKNRDGAVGTINLAFFKEYNKFVNLEFKPSSA